METDSRFSEIIQGAYSIFIQNGIRNVSMDDVSRSLGISKKTLYQYVDNKVDLLRKINDYIRELIKERIQELEKLNLNAIDVLLEMSKVANERHFKINPVISFEIKKFYPKVYDDYICTKKEILIGHIIKNLKQGIEEGLYRKELKIDIVAQLYFKKIEDFHNEDNVDFENFSYQKVFKVMFENHIRGIANEAGIKYFEQQKEKLNFNI
jgi:AcrR family transcriptional regulator